MEIPQIEETMHVIQSQLQDREEVTAVGELLVNPSLHYTRIALGVLAGYGILLVICLRFTELARIINSLEIQSVPFTILYLLAGVCVVALAADHSTHNGLPSTNTLLVVTNQRYRYLHLASLEVTEIAHKTSEDRCFNYDDKTLFKLKNGMSLRMKPTDNKLLLSLKSDTRQQS